MKKIAVIQARMLSSRLRGKSLMSVNGVPLLYRVIRAVKNIGIFDDIIVVTTKSEADNPIVAIVNEFVSDVKVFRGDALNVLKRFTDATASYAEDDIVFRFTADNLFYNKKLTLEAFKSHQNEHADYTHIDGLSYLVPEIIKISALREANRNAHDFFDQEHVTPYIRKHPHSFKINKLPKDFGGLKPYYGKYLTIDTRQQLDFIEQMLQNIGKEQEYIEIKDIYTVIQEKLNQKDDEPDKKISVILDGTPVGPDYPTYIIAEIGQNHNGQVELAKQLIDMAVEAGANAVKFQKRDIPSELTKEAFNKPYDNPNSFGRTYGEHRIALELDEEQHRELKEYAMARGITYFVTPTDIPSVDMMERLDVPFYKVASRDLTNIPLLHRLAQTCKPVIISTGMATLQDIDEAVEALGKDRKDIIILQCISQYPADLDRVNLKVMDTLKERYGKIVGFSDHTTGIVASVTASILGASVIEKHITLNKAMKGSDQAGSAERDELTKMIQFIRESRLTLGDGVKDVDPVTNKAKIKLARSITSKRNIKKGEILTEDMITLKSPGDGLLWREKGKILGKKARRDIEADYTLREADFE